VGTSLRLEPCCFVAGWPTEPLPEGLSWNWRSWLLLVEKRVESPDSFSSLPQFLFLWFACSVFPRVLLRFLFGSWCFLCSSQLFCSPPTDEPPSAPSLLFSAVLITSSFCSRTFNQRNFFSLGSEMRSPRCRDLVSARGLLLLLYHQ